MVYVPSYIKSSVSNAILRMGISKKVITEFGVFKYPSSPFDQKPLFNEKIVIDRINELSPAGTCLDIGSWIGEIAILLARYSARVVALEPDPTNYRYLKKNIDLNSMDHVIIPMNVALSDKEGDTDLALSTSSAGHTIAPSKSSDLLFLLGTKVKVKTITLDNLREMYPIELAVMDIEGKEFDIPLDYKLPNAGYLVNRWIIEVHSSSRPLQTTRDMRYLDSRHVEIF